MRPALESLIAETQSELAFRQARRDALHNILQFTTETSNHGMGAAGLRAQIEELARLVPDVLSGAERHFARANHYRKDLRKDIPIREHATILRDMGARRRPAAVVPQSTHA